MNIGLAPPCTRPEQKTPDSCVSEGILIALKVSSKTYSETKKLQNRQARIFLSHTGACKKILRLLSLKNICYNVILKINTITISSRFVLGYGTFWVPLIGFTTSKGSGNEHISKSTCTQIFLFLFNSKQNQRYEHLIFYKIQKITGDQGIYI